MDWIWSGKIDPCATLPYIFAPIESTVEIHSIELRHSACLGTSVSLPITTTIEHFKPTLQHYRQTGAKKNPVAQYRSGYWKWITTSPAGLLSLPDITMSVIATA